MYLAIHRAVPLLPALMLACVPLSQASASFSSIHVFGDGVCTTTASPSPSNLYYPNPGAAGEKRFCNGRVWTEVLSEWQGLTYDPTKNESALFNGSDKLLDYANDLVAPLDVATALFVIWSNDADFVDYGSIYDSSDDWVPLLSQSIANHEAAITVLYNKGVRLIFAPNAVDVMQTPFFNDYDLSEREYIRDRISEYNAMFEASMSGLMTDNDGLMIYRADTFAFFNQVIANPTAYGMINPPREVGNLGSLDSGSSALDGPGADYVFWDLYHPTAKFQMHLAAFFQQMISPVTVNSIARLGGDVQMLVANVPLGRAGVIQGSANLQPPWASDLPISEPFVPGGNTTKTFTFPASGTKRFYRVGFPVVWTWP